MTYGPGSQHNDARRQTVVEPDSQWLVVEFDWGGHTYLVELAGYNVWNAHILARLNDQLMVVTDLRSGQQLFVTWSQVGVMRLACAVDDKGLRVQNRR